MVKKGEVFLSMCWLEERHWFSPAWLTRRYFSASHASPLNEGCMVRIRVSPSRHKNQKFTPPVTSSSSIRLWNSSLLRGAAIHPHIHTSRRQSSTIGKTPNVFFQVKFHFNLLIFHKRNDNPMASASRSIDFEYCSRSRCLQIDTWCRRSDETIRANDSDEPSFNTN
ncbi:hypothetical protein BC829DRAFT_51746 [Chytridium lagenaria]|nr:hypothetical protein BC829DRAFT_51746 [Chytridium lagenaria]